MVESARQVARSPVACAQLVGQYEGARTMKLKYRILNFYERVFTSKLDDRMTEIRIESLQNRHLALYWEDVAKGLLPMPDKDANIPWLAHQAAFKIIMRKHAKLMLNQPGNRFRITDVGD